MEVPCHCFEFESSGGASGHDGATTKSTKTSRTTTTRDDGGAGRRRRRSSVVGRPRTPPPPLSRSVPLLPIVPPLAALSPPAVVSPARTRARGSLAAVLSSADTRGHSTCDDREERVVAQKNRRKSQPRQKPKQEKPPFVVGTGRTAAAIARPAILEPAVPRNAATASLRIAASARARCALLRLRAAAGVVRAGMLLPRSARNMSRLRPPTR